MPTKKGKLASPRKGEIKGDILMIWKANGIVFISSFCVMVIEIIAARILAPYIGVSLYTWTTIIGVILAGIALGNYVGGKIADKRPSPLILVAIFFIGGLLTIAIPPLTRMVGDSSWPKNMPIMLSFTLQTSSVFFLPAFVLSMVSPLVIKLTLADLGRTGGVVGTIYAISTAGSILGTFMTGFIFILLFGIRMLLLLVGGVLILTGILSLFAWKMPNRWKPSLRNVSIWIATMIVLLAYILAFNPSKQEKLLWQKTYNEESNYYTITVRNYPGDENIQVLSLDHLVHSYVDPNNPLYFKYDYLKIFSDMVHYFSAVNEAPKTLHLGGGGYSFPKYMETIYPKSVNEVVEIDPAVTLVAQEKLGLNTETSIDTYNQDARFFLTQRVSNDKYDFVIGDVFNDCITPYHLTTLEFDRLVKANMQKNGVYLINTIDDFQKGKYLPSLIRTLEKVFHHVYILGTSENWDTVRLGTFVIVATDLRIDTSEYSKFINREGNKARGYIYDEAKLEKYLALRKAVILTDDYAPTDIMLAPLVRERAKY